MKTLGIIPARYASTRFPGKPLKKLGGRSMIEWVWRGVKASGLLDRVIVATDDEAIKEAVEGFGGEVMMTSDRHRSGTDRCGEVIAKLQGEGRCYDVVVNIQGDEPEVCSEQLRQLLGCFESGNTEIATLKKRIESEAELETPNVVKVVVDRSGNALYFSRYPLPYLRGEEEGTWLGKERYYKHIGMYGYRWEVLQEIVKLEVGELERCESLEQLRWIENGYKIRVAETQEESLSIDTPEDAEKLEARWRERGIIR